MADRLRKVQELFEQASDLDPAECREFLYKASGGDDTLVTEVEELLRHDHESNDSLYISVQHQAAGAFRDKPRRETIGKYRVLRELGQGGMGTAALTRSGMRLMTPEDASPEQARGGVVNTATDVYSLGVLLRKLLADELPCELDWRNVGVIEKIICEQAPVRPSQQQSDVGSELDDIVAMAHRKEPARRFGTVSAFADDLQPYLDDRPNLADNSGERAGDLLKLGLLFEEAGDRERSRNYLSRALAIYEVTQVPESPRLRTVRDALARLNAPQDAGVSSR